MKKIIGYKTLTEDMLSPRDHETKWTVGGVTSLPKNKPLKITNYGLHLYKSLDNITIGLFGSRVFKAEIIGDYVEYDNIFAAYSVKLLEEIKPSKVTNSFWAYKYCLYVKNDPKVKKNIIKSQHAYYYCIDVKDDPDVRKRIITSKYAFKYCFNIKDDPAVRKYITDKYWLKQYCMHINTDPNFCK